MTGQPLLPVDYSQNPRSSHLHLVKSLVIFRQEWEAAAQGESLINIQAPVGLLLADVLERLDIEQEERVAVLGIRLYSEVETVREG